MSRATRAVPPSLLASLSLLFALAFAAPAPGRAQETPAAGAATSCLACHGSAEWFDQEVVDRIVGGFRGDVHAGSELSCHDCHGGNPDPALAEDFEAAMDPGYEANPYVGVPERQAIPAFCGRCHSDPAFMRRYHPDPRVDQEREYRTSHHGRALAAGDEKVATCVDCHGTHGIQGPAASGSPVHPARVASTCRRCHGDPDYMAGYTTDDGRPLPVDQFALWNESVHAAAMYGKEDLSAPTCNDCHGNHGATPPGLDSIAFVCGQCHGREAELFRASTKRQGFESHNEYLEDLGPQGCASCHEEPEPQATVEGVHSFSECATCHGNHAVVRPTVAMLSPLPAIPCAFCHEAAAGPTAEASTVPTAPAVAADPAEPERVRRHYEEVRDGLLAAAEADGLAGEELFDWMVDRALEVPAHNLPAAAGEAAEGVAGGDGAAAAQGEAASTLRPEFERLFQKFRIGKTHFTYHDPVSGREVRGRVRRCSDCHGETPVMAGEPVGHRTGQVFLENMRELTALTARAERMTLAAQRGGVLVEDASLAVERAVDAQIEQEVLVHGFSAEEGSAFAEKHREGMEQARTALGEAQAALDELAFRRRGLVVTLGVILLVLVGLALEIRQLGGR